MNVYLTFIIVALVCLVLGVPVWVVVFAPGHDPLSLFVDPGFWLSIGVGLALLLLGFWLGKRADVGQ
jgi:hypothetical protein